MFWRIGGPVIMERAAVQAIERQQMMPLAIASSTRSPAVTPAQRRMRRRTAAYKKARAAVSS